MVANTIAEHIWTHINEIKLVTTADGKQHSAVNKIAGLLELCLSDELQAGSALWVMSIPDHACSDSEPPSLI